MKDKSMIVNFEEDAIFEETKTQLYKSTWPRVVARVKEHKITASFMGIKADGTLLFSTNSYHTPGRRFTVQVRFENFDEVQKKFKRHFFRRKTWVAKMLRDGDIKVNCTCEMFKYYCAYTAWTEGYGLRKELRPAVLRNPHNDKIVCKHTLAALLLLADAWDVIYSRYQKEGYFVKRGAIL